VDSGIVVYKGIANLKDDIKNNLIKMDSIVLIILILVVFRFRKISLKVGNWFKLEAKK
jgi:hypothetical protein